MKISVLIINSNPEKLDITLKSLSYQTFGDYESLIIPSTVDNRLDELKSAVELAQGEYCLFLNAGDCLANDFVLQEAISNELDKDIVFGNLIVEDDNIKEQFIILPEKLRASDLLINDFPYQAVLVKTESLKQIEFTQNSFPMMIWTCIAYMLLQKQVSYKHIQFFVCRCNNIIPTNRKQALEIVFPFFEEDYAELYADRKLKASENYKLLIKLQNTKLFKSVMYFRQKFQDWGLYELKAKYKQKKYYWKIKQADEQQKKTVAQFIAALPANLLPRNNDKNDIIVSLTSYGNRVIDSVPFALYSLFTQTQLPNRIILNLDKNKWNDANIPLLLKQLQKSGLEINYCEDTGPHTKLIPTLSSCPDNIIITVDDDVYYDKQLVEQLVNSYNNSDRKSVICRWGKIFEKQNSEIVTYSKLKDSKFGNQFNTYIPYGVAGVLYPPHVFSKEIFNKLIYREMCPYADDIWFGLIEYMENVNVLFISDTTWPDGISDVNRLDEWVEGKSNALYIQNDFYGRNDKQFKELIKYYNL